MAKFISFPEVVTCVEYSSDTVQEWFQDNTISSLLVCGDAKGILHIFSFLQSRTSLFMPHASDSRSVTPLRIYLPQDLGLHKDYVQYTHHQLTRATSQMKQVHYIAERGCVLCSWEGETSVILHPLRPYITRYTFNMSHPVSCFCYDHRRRLLVAASRGGEVLVWDVYLPSWPVLTLTARRVAALHLVLADYLVILTYSCELLLYDMEEFSMVKQIPLVFPVSSPPPHELGPHPLTVRPATNTSALVLVSCQSYIARVELTRQTAPADVTPARTIMPAVPLLILTDEFGNTYDLLLGERELLIEDKDKVEDKVEDKVKDKTEDKITDNVKYKGNDNERGAVENKVGHDPVSKKKKVDTKTEDMVEDKIANKMVDNKIEDKIKDKVIDKIDEVENNMEGRPTCNTYKDSRREADSSAAKVVTNSYRSTIKGEVKRFMEQQVARGQIEFGMLASSERIYQKMVRSMEDRQQQRHMVTPAQFLHVQPLCEDKIDPF